MISARAQSMDASGIRKVFDLAGEMTNPVNLSIGAPDFSVPEPVADELIQAVQSGKTRYTPTQGIEELRSGILKSARHKLGVEFEDVIVTAGVSGGLMLAFAALLDPGDEVVFADPYFVGYPQIARLFSAIPVTVDTYPDFQLTPERLEPAIGPKTRIILLNSPSNPTGAVLSPKSIKGITELAKRNNCVIISDDIYDAFVFDGPADNPAAYYSNTLVLNGFSKSHSMTGLRTGYALGPSEIINEMKKVQQFTFVNSSSIAQYAAVKALEWDTSEYRDRYQQNRDRVCESLSDRFELVRPQGAFYVFARAPGGSGMEFVKKAIQKNLLIIPGNVFSKRDTHFRIAIATDRETIERGIELLNQLAETIK